MDDGFKALVGFIGAHGDSLEFLEFAKEVLDEVPPFVEFGVERQGRRAPWMLRDDDLGAALVQASDDTIAVERLVGDQSIEGEAVDERGNADRIETMAGQENEAHEIAERIGEGEDLGRHAALGAADGLALSPPFAPWPWRWTLTMVASTMAYSMSGCSEQASKSLMKTSALTQSRYRLKTVFQLPKKAGRSRHGLPVRTIQSTASTKRRLSLPLRPGSAGLPKQCGSIFAHWASVSTNRSIQSLNHNQPSDGILNLNRP